MSNYYKSDQKKYLKTTVDILPKSLFIIFTVIGASAIWGMKGLHLPTLLVVLVPIALILTYCLLASTVRLFQIREEQIGDNSYYLGFLYTLSSLSYALWNFSRGDGSPEDIIGSFGVGLWSTIIGIALRVFFAQIRQDPHDIEKETRAKIAETASMLTSELHRASLAFNSYTLSLQQSVEEAFQKNSDSMNDSFAHSLEKFAQVTDEISVKLHSSFQELGTNAQQMHAASAKTIKSIELLNNRIEKVEAPDDLMNNKIRDIFLDLEDSQKRLSKTANLQAETVQKIADNSSILFESIKLLNSEMNLLRETSMSIEASNQNVVGFSHQVDGLSKTIANLTSSMVSLDGQQKSVVSSISKHADELEQQLTRSRGYTEETHRALSAMTQTLSEKLA